MSLTGHGPKSRTRHRYQITAYTEQQSPELYKGDKGINDAVRPPEGGPTEAGDHSASVLPLLDNTHRGQSQQQINAVGVIPGVLFVSIFYHTGIDTRSMTQRLDNRGIRGGECHIKQRLEPCVTMLVIGPQGNVGLMNLAGHGPLSGSRHRCLIIA